ncbi:lysophospholipid acyltransferase family protein [Paracoccus sp. (in: a-proteobacteria)]|uniref:lysophospholipid acyltransferase family protein n=1 Tax=Paracoccus sp. TaxID=267 RepID=UPI003A8A5FAB
MIPVRENGDAGRHAAEWDRTIAPELPRPDGIGGWWRVLRRGVPAVAVLLVGVILILPLRGLEWAVWRSRRPVTGPYVQGICRLVLICMGLRWQREGMPMRGPGAVVANHSSWLDILTMNAAMPIFFVSKSEVRRWPGINILTAVTNTHFVIRDPKLARAQALELSARVRAGHRLLFFPEGTSTDGLRVLPFKPTLFQGFLDPDLPPDLAIQPLSAVYHAPDGADPRFYGWWGDMALANHILTVLSARRQGSVAIRLGPPVTVAGHNRKSLSAEVEARVREGFR